MIKTKKPFIIISLVSLFLAFILFISFQPFSAKAEVSTTYTLGVSASKNPSGFGDPYYKNPYWFYGEFSQEDILTSGVTFAPDHSDVNTFLSQLYSLVSSYSYEFGGTDLTTTVYLTNGTDQLSITFFYSYSSTSPEIDNSVSSSDGTSIYYSGAFRVAPYILPYNSLYVTDVVFSVYGGMFTLSAATLPVGGDFLISLSYLFGEFIPMFQSVGYIDSLNGGGGSGGSPDYDSGYRAGYGNGYGNGYTIGFQQGANSINPDSIIQNYLNSEAFQQEIDYYKLQGELEYKNSEAYQDALENSKDSGYNQGKATGYNEGLRAGQKGDFFALFSAVFDAPISVIMNLVDFEILGYNLKQFVLSIFSVLLIVVLIRFFLTFSSK